MELIIRTRGQYDALEILFSEAFSEEIQRQLIEQLEKVKGVENGAAARYSIDVATAPHIAPVEAIVDEVLKIFQEPELRAALSEFGVTKIRVVRGEGSKEFLPITQRTSEV